MSKKADKQTQFSQLRGAYSERMRANGAFEGFAATPELYAPLVEQHRRGKARIAELRQIPVRTPEETREMENHIRLVGSWEKQIKDMSQRAFEMAFAVVAQVRLPKEHFIVISDEARQLWRAAKFHEGLPIDHKKVRKCLRRRDRHPTA